MPAYEHHQPVFPGGARCAACLTFDFDAESGWLSRDPSVKDRPGVISQGVYGAKVAVPRILELLDAEQLRATFFIPGWVAEAHPRPSEAIRDAGHEIGHHGYLHERNQPDNAERERWNFENGLRALQEVLGVRPLGYRSPSCRSSGRSTTRRSSCSTRPTRPGRSRSRSWSTAPSATS